MDLHTGKERNSKLILVYCFLCAKLTKLEFQTCIK